MIDFLTLSDPFLWHYVRKYVPPSIKIGNFLLEKNSSSKNYSARLLLGIWPKQGARDQGWWALAFLLALALLALCCQQFPPLRFLEKTHTAHNTPSKLFVKASISRLVKYSLPKRRRWFGQLFWDCDAFQEHETRISVANNLKIYFLFCSNDRRSNQFHQYECSKPLRLSSSRFLSFWIHFETVEKNLKVGETARRICSS